MKTIVDAQITLVRVGTASPYYGLDLVVEFEFNGLVKSWIFRFCFNRELTEEAEKVGKEFFYEESMKALELMNYAGVGTIDRMEGKNIRVVLASEVIDSDVIGFGHPTDDNRFFKVKGNFEIISKEEIMK